jgi:hypothetical protein
MIDARRGKDGGDASEAVDVGPPSPKMQKGTGNIENGNLVRDGNLPSSLSSDSAACPRFLPLGSAGVRPALAELTTPTEKTPHVHHAVSDATSYW